MAPRWVKTMGSLRLSAALLFASAVLVFFGTLDQVTLGIRGAQVRYFESLGTFWQYPAHWWGGDILQWLHLPIPGGYLLGPLFLINLACSHFVFFRPKWQRLGIVLIHLGMGLLLVGQLVTNIAQEESYMWLDENGTSNYLQSFNEDELVIIDVTDPTIEPTVAFDAAKLEAGQRIRNPRLPFVLKVEAIYENAMLAPRQAGDPPPAVNITAGVGAGNRFSVTPQASVTDPKKRNLATAVIRLEGPEADLGTWLVCTAFEDQMPPQVITYEDRRYKISMRFKRTPLPYSLTLLDFVHERYPGTNIPKRFSSEVRIQNPDTGEDRVVSVYMNHPLRYDGRTFYQASFGKSDTASMFQVVSNPGWLMPYVASALMTLGMVYQFSLRLFRRGPRPSSKEVA
jgi:hypothetical protein